MLSEFSMVARMALAVAPSQSPPLIATAKNFDHHHHHNHKRLLHLLTQCTSMSQLKQIHALTLRTTHPDHLEPTAFFVYTRLLHFSSLHDLDYTLKLFNQIQTHNCFTYNTLIRAFAHSKDHKDQAFLLYEEMLLSEQESVFPDKHTFPFVLKACAYLFALSEGKQAHAHALKLGLGSDVYVNNSLIHLYSSCGSLKDAKRVFNDMDEKTVVSWNVMIEGLVQLGEFDEALRMFAEMGNYFDPDGYTMQSVVSACAGLGALSLGLWAHAYVLKNCKFDGNVEDLLNGSLVDMYCKCGSLELAMQVFETMSKRNVNSWNSMILGLAMHGEVELTFEYFSRMVNEERIMPNSITFVGLLSACNHRGLVEEGQKYFEMMTGDYKIKPVLEHYGCLVDLLARAGLLDEAIDVVLNMPMKPDAVIWRILLDACCKKNGGLELSEEVARQIIESDGSDSSGVFVLLSRVYASANKWNEVGMIRKLMTDKGVTKEPGCSLIEIDGTAHEFFAGDSTHPRTREIYQFLNVIEERLKGAGHVADVSEAAMVDEQEGERGNSLRLHSERLAIAFGLLNSKPGVPIRVYKNLRVCNDCHNVIKLISKIFNVEIIVRDRLRFHRFKDGSCSCKDYW